MRLHPLLGRDELHSGALKLVHTVQRIRTEDCISAEASAQH